MVNSLRLKPTDCVLVGIHAQQKINHFLHGKALKIILCQVLSENLLVWKVFFGTPSGLHYVCQKIGEGEKLGTVFEGRVSIGMTYSSARLKKRKNLITTRILRLKGLEEGVNSVGKSILTIGTYMSMARITKRVWVSPQVQLSSNG